MEPFDFGKMTETELRIAAQVAQEATTRAFENRRGHRGGKCAHRVLRPQELKSMFTLAALEALHAIRKEETA